jgi:ArsR family transcriptional regulator, arsenate/arsenite/antimonite-responsive transcriptional repressor
VDELEALRAISENTRWQIIQLLSKETLCGKAVAGRLQMTESAASQHLTKLKRAGVITMMFFEGWKHYSVNWNRLAEVSKLLSDLINSKHEPKLCRPLASNEPGMSLSVLRSYCKNCIGTPATKAASKKGSDFPA